MLDSQQINPHNKVMEEAKALDNTDYFPIKIKSIHPIMPIPFNIFVMVNNKYIHYLRAGDAISIEKQKKL